MSTKSITDFTTGYANVYDHKGKTVIPKDIRDKMGLEEGDRLKFIHDGENVYVFKAGDVLSTE